MQHRCSTETTAIESKVFDSWYAEGARSLNRYGAQEHLRANIAEFIEEYYNRPWLHSALGYRPPEEFEQESEVSNQAESRRVTLKLFENSEIGKNPKEVSGVVAGEGDSVAVPFPGFQIRGTLNKKCQVRPRILSH